MQTTNDVIVVTGAAGFIGSCLVGYLNEQGYNNIVVVDDFSRSDKAINLEDKKFTDKVERDQFFQRLQQTMHTPVEPYYLCSIPKPSVSIQHSISGELRNRIRWYPFLRRCEI